MKEPREFERENHELENLLQSHMDEVSREQIDKLDQRMNPLFLEEHGPSRGKTLERRPFAWQLALSHALIAVLFFAGGFLLSQGGDFLRPSGSSADVMSELSMETRTPKMSSDFEDPVRINAAGSSVSRELRASSLAEEEDAADALADSDESTTAMAASAESASEPSGELSGGSVSPAQPAAANLLSAIRNYAEAYQGYLYALTPTSLMRVRLEDAEILIDDLHAPAGLEFDAEGNVLIMDETEQGLVIWKLERMKSTEESDRP